MKFRLVLCLIIAGLMLTDAAPLLRASTSQQAIPGQYIVSFRRNLADTQMSMHLQTIRRMLMDYGYTINHVYQFPSWSGYAMTAPTGILNYVLASPLVAYVEEDQIVRHTACVTESNSAISWGIDRIDSRQRALNQEYIYSDQAAGEGVTAYVIDTGIATNHSDFEGRATMGATFEGTDPWDCNGHGTHVSGTIGSVIHGVAKKVTLVGVKVLDCNGSGSISNVIAGVNWVSNNAANPSKSVANMSLGGGLSTSLGDAVSAAVSRGIIFAVAAGNDNTDACNQTPANVRSALTVGATTSSDARASYSNWGSCVDIFAPGSNIVSTWNDGKYNTLSGTSMATPHVAGVAAVMRSNPSLTGVQASTVVGAGTQNTVNLNCGFLNLRCKTTTRTLLYSSC